MSGRKVDYFGTFLENLKSRQSVVATPASSNVGSAGSGNVQPQPGPDPVNEVLKALRDGGALSAKDLIALVGNSVSLFLSISNELINQGWVARLDGDRYALTDKGHEIAALLA